MKPGDVIADRFEIERLAGSGGMGAVYRSRDRVTGAPAAVKVLWARFLEQPEHAERFTREARVLMELDHPGIVRYLAHGITAEGEPFLALEWLEGESLSQRLRRQGLTVAETVALGRRLAEALGAAHRRGIVHRDLKPSNVQLVGGSLDEAKLIDFGIAKVAGGEPLTMTGTVMGTPYYMAPEQARGVRKIDARADVFALGSVLFHCLTGRAPFAGDEMHAALLKVVLEDAPRVCVLRDDVPEALDDLVAEMLARPLDERPADGDAVARALAALGELGAGQSSLPSGRGAALTGRELRVSCAVLARLVAGGPASGPLLPTASMTLPGTLSMEGPDPRRPAVLAAVRRHHGEVHDLPPGVLVITFPGAEAPTDQAAQAARCALAVREVLPGAPVAAIAGRGAPAVTAEGSGLLERGLVLLEAPPSAIRLDDVLAGLLGARFQIEGDEAGLVLTGEREAGLLARTVLGKPTPCVGRDHEIAVLEAVLAECAAEPCARAVAVIAPPGIGKSRLAAELSRRAPSRGAQVWTAQGDPMSAGSPFGMLAQAVRREVGLREGEPKDVQAHKLRARVARHVPEREVMRVATFLGELAGVRAAGEDSVEIRAARNDAVLMGDQMRRAFEDLLIAETEAGPLVLLLEDLHWGDLPSVKVIDAMLRNLRERPLFVLALGRPEIEDVFPRLWAERGVQQIHLRELGRRGSERLVREVLGDRADAAVVGRIVDVAGGNPFYLEELIRAAASGEAAHFPETVLAMVEARLASLDPEARRVLRAASVFGQVMWRGGVAALLGSSVEGVSDRLAELCDREVLARRGEGRFPGEEEYAFRHGLLREAAYATLTGGDRALGHLLAAAWLTQKGERDALVLAEHLERGGEPERAVLFYQRAAEQALEGDDFGAAIARAERGAAHARGETLGALRLLEAEAHKWMGSAAEAERCAVEAMRRLPPRSAQWYVAASEAASMRLRLGRHDELAALASEVRALGLGLSPSVPPPPASGPLGESARPSSIPAWAGAAVSAVARLAGSLLHDGQHALAEALIAEIDRVASPLAERDFTVAARVYALHASRALCYGDPAASLRYTELSIPSYAYTGDRRNACLGRVNAAHALLQLGDDGKAERALRSALADAERMGLANVSALGRQNLAAALLRQGVLDEARAAATAAITAFAAQSNRRQEGRSRAYLAEILAAGGDLEGAEREARAAVVCVGSIPPLSAFALGVLSRVLLARKDPRAALDHAREGSALAEALAGMEEGEARLRLALAESLSAIGDRAGAARAIQAAHDRLLARAARIDDAGRRTSFLRRVPENARTLDLAGGGRVT
ncbi:Adenylate cyclase [Minicystis rosea]|nr:Adenylate cyclase [Minicystis rosea]